MKPIRELDENHADIVDHGQEHLADVFGLARFGPEKIDTADFRGSFDDPGDIGTEHVRDLLNRNSGVFNDVVQQRGAERGDVELHVGKDVGDGKWMREVKLAGFAELQAVLLGGKIVGAAKQVEVIAGTVATDLVHQLNKAEVKDALRRSIGRGFDIRIHGILIVRRKDDCFIRRALRAGRRASPETFLHKKNRLAKVPPTGSEFGSESRNPIAKTDRFEAQSSFAG